MPQAGSHIPLGDSQSRWEWETSSQLPSAPPTPFSLWDLLSHPTLSPPGSTSSHIPAASPPQCQRPIPHPQHGGEPRGSPLLSFSSRSQVKQTQEFLGSVLAEHSEQMVP